MKNDVLTVQLASAKALIEDPAHWTQKHMARDAHDQHAVCGSPDAVKWCALGAVRRVIGQEASLDDYSDALEDAAVELFALNHVKVNDQLGHAAVMQMYDRAIANSQS